MLENHDVAKSRYQTKKDFILTCRLGEVLIMSTHLMAIIMTFLMITFVIQKCSLLSNLVKNINFIIMNLWPLSILAIQKCLSKG